MPAKKSPTPKELSKRLQRRMNELSLTQQGISTATQINQSQVSRILNGRFTRISSRNIMHICEYLCVDMQNNDVKRPDPSKSSLLMDALSHVWDGTEEGERVLAGLIGSIAALRAGLPPAPPENHQSA